MGKRYSRIGELLVKEKFINVNDLNYVLNVQSKEGIHKKVGKILLEKKLIEKKKLREALGLFFGVETVDIVKCEIDITALAQIDLKTALEMPCIPYKFTSGSKGISLNIALPDPFNYRYIEKLSLVINYPVVPVFAFEDDIINEIRFYSSQFENKKGVSL